MTNSKSWKILNVPETQLTQKGNAMSNPILDALMETHTIIKLKKRSLVLRRIVKNASGKVDADHGAIDGASQVTANRLAGADEWHKKICAVQNAVSTVIDQYTQPYTEEPGCGLLPNLNFELVVGALHPLIKEHDQLVEQNRQYAAETVRRAALGVGTLDVRLPTEEEIANGYELKVEFKPIPDSSNFKGFHQSTIDKLRQQHDAKLEAAVLAAEQHTLNRFVKPIDKFIEGMKAYEERLERMNAEPEKKDLVGVFRDTLVGNIKELWEQLDKFNISGDPRFTQLGNDLASLVNAEPKELRDNPVLRSAAVDRAKQVADNLNSWLVK